MPAPDHPRHRPPPASGWRHGRDHYRPAGEPIRTADYDVAAIPGDATARAFVLAHHYSGSYPAARRRFGLYRRGGELVGVAVFSEPMNRRAVTVPLGGDGSDAAELGRFVLVDSVPANGESWFLARAFACLRAEDWRGVVSFSDPVPRRTAAGAVVFPGHLGVIYQATNAAYLGRGTARTLRLLPDGAVLSERAISKLRARAARLTAGQGDAAVVARERGWRYAAELLEGHGAGPAPADDGPALAAWTRRAVVELTRPLRHHGNHRYAWSFARDGRRHLEEAKAAAGCAAYPKARDAA